LINPDAFCKYYCPQYFDPANKGAEFGYFHHQAIEDVLENIDLFAVYEWPREHAKSVLFGIFLILLLNARGELDGVILSSQSGDKATGLLSDVQAELVSNQRYINDYGDQKTHGSWTEGHFVTRDGVGFWAVGKRQSPRGIREAEKRPNFLLVDDFDDDVEVRNEALVKKSLDWLKGALIGAMSIIDSRIIIVGNRIHKKSVLAQVVGNVEDDDPINEGITYRRVYALENPVTREEEQGENGVPAWRERYTVDHLRKRMRIMGYRMAQREFFHHQIIEGTTFKEDWFHFAPLPLFKHFEAVVTYCDPSFKDSKKNDFKAIVAVGKIGRKRYLIDVWLRQASRLGMAAAHYNMHEDIERKGVHILKSYIEANFMQDLLIEDYKTEAESRGYYMPIYEDKRAKPNKQGRIEGLSPSFEQGLWIINEELKNSTDWQVFKTQLLGFPNEHDDGPDAMEGADFKLREIRRTTQMPTGGTYEKRNQF
jgi:predicted phage terminase large subunit-like protein